MKFVSFCAGGNYKKVLYYWLLPSLEKFKLYYDIDYINDKGSWAQNIQYKPQFIKNMLVKHKQPIVSLDADAEIKKYPALFHNTTLTNDDIALHYLDNGLQWRNIPSPNGKKEALGGTLYFNYNEKVLNFINEWIEAQKIDRGYPQKTMQRLLEKNTYNLNIYKLPYSYATIIKQDDTLPLHMIKKDEIVILHNQISRKMKRR